MSMPRSITAKPPSIMKPAIMRRRRITPTAPMAMPAMPSIIMTRRAGITPSFIPTTDNSGKRGVAFAVPLKRDGFFLTSTRILQQHGGGFFGDHRGRRVGIAGRDRRHDRGIGDAQPVQPKKTQALVD